MDDCGIDMNSSYIRRLLWQCRNSPRYVMITPPKAEAAPALGEEGVSDCSPIAIIPVSSENPTIAGDASITPEKKSHDKDDLDIGEQGLITPRKKKRVTPSTTPVHQMTLRSHSRRLNFTPKNDKVEEGMAVNVSTPTSVQFERRDFTPLLKHKDAAGRAAEIERLRKFVTDVCGPFIPLPDSISYLAMNQTPPKTPICNTYISNTPKRDSETGLITYKSTVYENRGAAFPSVGFVDRFIPNRDIEEYQIKFGLLGSDHGTEYVKKCTSRDGHNKDSQAYHSLLKNEVLGTNIDTVLKPKTCCSGREPREKPHVVQNLFNYKHNSHENQENIESLAPYSLCSLKPASQKLLRSPQRQMRKISRIPFKVLDAPELQDDFYLNLVDWSVQNVLAVGLGSAVYLWSATTSQVTKLCDLQEDHNNTVTSVSWNGEGNHVAIGTHHGYVQIWDAPSGKLLCKLVGHSARVGALGWNGSCISSGSRDRAIMHRDIRHPDSLSFKRFLGHRQEVCGLKWDPGHNFLASGGNDNRLHVWDIRHQLPVHTFTQHVAAVKAIAWSPHHHGILVSGGGTADRCIRFWNTVTGSSQQNVDTGSQVCNLAWSKHSSELVSTHGYSQNQIVVWKYPSLCQVAKLTGHSYRVLYLAMSPDGECIVTGAGDETLRFWNVFSKTSTHKPAGNNFYDFISFLR